MAREGLRDGAYYVAEPPAPDKDDECPVVSPSGVPLDLVEALSDVAGALPEFALDDEPCAVQERYEDVDLAGSIERFARGPSWEGAIQDERQLVAKGVLAERLEVLGAAL